VTDLEWLLNATGVPVPTRTLDASEPPEAMLYTDFVAELGFALDAGQYVFARVAFDGIDPADLETPEQRELARVIFGPLERLPSAARAVVMAVCGGRAGKTRMGAMRLLHLALTVPLPDVAPGEVASAPIIAPDLALATQPLDYIKGACRHPDILPLVMNLRHLEPASEGIDLRREDGKLVEIVCRAASGRGRTGRGRTLVAALLDEAAFFLDATYKVNDAEVFKAVRPRVVAGGQTLVMSTPWAQAGLLYDSFIANHANPSVAGLSAPPRCEGTALAAHAPSLVLRPGSATMREMVESETKRDPENGAREFGAQFMAAGADTFFDAACITATVDYAMPLETLPTPGQEVAAGGDFGFANNSTALAIAHLGGARVELGFLREWRPPPGSPLKPSTVVHEAAADLARHGARTLMSDRHYRESVVEFLSEAGLGFLDAPAVPSEGFVKVRALMREGRVRIPNHERLLRQLRETVGRKTAGGGVQIVLPRWRTGEHGDLVSAFVLAVYQAAGELVVAPPPAYGSPEYWRAQEVERLAKRRREVDQAAREPFWKRALRK